jgi:RNA polymerase sigma-B factor
MGTSARANHHPGMTTLRSPTPPPPAAQALIESHLGLARGLARRYARPGGDPLEDLQQVACVGLVKASQRFEPERGIPFRAYAVPMIVGELRRYLRASRWPAHVPRSVQELALRLPGAEQAFIARHARRPTAEEMAEVLDCSVEDLLEARLADRSRAPVSFDDAGGADDDAGVLLAERVGERDTGFEAAELRRGARPGPGRARSRRRRRASPAR